jgi:hypothetical protein
LKLRTIFAILFTAPAFAAAAESFEQALHGQMVSILYDAGAIDPVTLKEDKDSRRADVKRHKELDAWFEGKGRNVSLLSCKTEVDKANYRAFRTEMSNQDFLGMKFRRRLRFVRKIDNHFGVMKRHFRTALWAVVDTPETGPGTLEAVIQNRLEIPAGLSLRYFGRARATTIGAMYHPRSHSIYLNLNFMTSRPALFVDSFEHELWHHLLPIVDRHHATDNIWFEGFAEAASELWSEELYEQIDRSPVIKSKDIEYPIQTAFASLCFGVNRRATFEYLADVSDLSAYQEALAVDSISNSLSALFAEPHFAHNGRARVTVMLSDWGWKEDDGGVIDISKYVAGEGLDKKAMATAFLYKKKMFLDLIQAVTVCKLQQFSELHSRKDLVHRVELPPHLRENLKEVLNYVESPYHQYANR